MPAEAALLVQVLPPYMPSPEERADPQLYAENVRRLMAKKLGAQLSTQSLKEQQLLKQHGVCVDWTGRCAHMPILASGALDIEAVQMPQQCETAVWVPHPHLICHLLQQFYIVRQYVISCSI